MRKSRIDPAMIFNWWAGSYENDDLVALAITKAYRDLMRTITGFRYNPNRFNIRSRAEKIIYQFVVEITNTKNLSQDMFDSRHRIVCYQLVDSFADQIFTIGQAQKWINMTFKYLNLLYYEPIDGVYEFCHVPIDNYILNITHQKISKPWSRLDDYEEYLSFQKWFRKEYHQIPLDEEFELWLKEKEKQNKAYH